MGESWLVRYYSDENAYRIGVPTYTEIMFGDRASVVSMIQTRLSSSPFRFYDLIPQ